MNFFKIVALAAAVGFAVTFIVNIIFRLENVFFGFDIPESRQQWIAGYLTGFIMSYIFFREVLPGGR